LPVKHKSKQRLEQLEAAQTRLARSRLNSGGRAEQEDYSYLSRVFGQDEIQLCEIQAAGPQVSTLVNALLEGCFDNKFEIRFRTQRPKADGKGMVDDFDVEVRNKNLDRTCLVDELRAAVRTVNEAVNLGIAIYNMRQGEGIRYETLFRDETVGLWMLQMARSTCVCCAVPWSWGISPCNLHLPHTARVGAGRPNPISR